MKHARFADVFSTLGSETRLALLETLRRPQILAEIEVSTEEGRGSISRQVIARHLERLVDAGLVERREVVRDGRDTVEFSVNHQALFLLGDSIAGLARLRPAVEPGGETAPARRADRSLAKGPCLVTVRGLEEGAVHPLRAGDRWVVGRRRDSAVALDFDPSISGAHCEIARQGDKHFLADLGSRNGTFVNFRPLAADERHELRHGDLIGVGRCALLYWA